MVGVVGWWGGGSGGVVGWWGDVGGRERAGGRDGGDVLEWWAWSGWRELRVAGCGMRLAQGRSPVPPCLHTVEIEPRNRVVVCCAAAIEGSAKTVEDILLRGAPTLYRSTIFRGPLSEITARLLPVVGPAVAVAPAPSARTLAHSSIRISPPSRVTV